MATRRTKEQQMRKFTREDVKAARYFIGQRMYEQAIQRLTWALRREAYAEGFGVGHKAKD